MIRSTAAYLKFLKNSFHLHGIHSPFIFNLQQKCVKDKTHYAEYEVMRIHRKALLGNQEAIQVRDHGAGSRVFSSNTRTINRIARHAGISVNRQQLLFRTCRYLEADRILELGTSLGMGTLALGLASPQATITTVEACPNTAAVAEVEWLASGVEQIDLQRKTFAEYFDSMGKEQFDLVYIDGDHSYEGCKLAFERLLPQMSKGGAMIFDDIHWSRSMELAWEELASHPKVTASVDTFGWGLLFFEPGRQKEHFYLRV